MHQEASGRPDGKATTHSSLPQPSTTAQRSAACLQRVVVKGHQHAGAPFHHGVREHCATGRVGRSGFGWLSGMQQHPAQCKLSKPQATRVQLSNPPGRVCSGRSGARAANCPNSDAWQAQSTGTTLPTHLAGSSAAAARVAAASLAARQPGYSKLQAMPSTHTHLAGSPAGAARGPCSAPAAHGLPQTAPRSVGYGPHEGPRSPPPLQFKCMGSGGRHMGLGNQSAPRSGAATTSCQYRFVAALQCREQQQQQQQGLPSPGCASFLAGAAAPRLSPASAAIYLVRMSCR